MIAPDAATEATKDACVRETLAAFLKLGLTSFGGPIAHLGYFRNEFVLRRQWLGEEAYAELVALCQFLPGPASSQVGFAIGLSRAGLFGGLAAWLGFTAPSAVAMVAFAYGARFLSGPYGDGLVHGLKLAAVAIVAQALCGMARTLTPDPRRVAIALGAAALTLVAGPAGQLVALVSGAALGLLTCGGAAPPPKALLGIAVSRRAAASCLVVFLGLLIALPLLHATTASQTIAVADAFYRSGALVFGGGHVVLPLLQSEIVAPGWIADDVFLAGYGAAQAMPGPLLSISAFLGASLAAPPTGFLGAALALVAIFLPGLLLVVAALPFWNGLRAHPSAQAALRGANAAVVGIIAAALYDPVGRSAIHGAGDVAVAASAFAALTFLRAPPILVVGATVGVALLRALV